MGKSHKLSPPVRPFGLQVNLKRLRTARHQLAGILGLPETPRPGFDGTVLDGLNDTIRRLDALYEDLKSRKDRRQSG